MKRRQEQRVSVSALEMFATCPLRTALQRNRIKPEQTTYPLIAGGALHKQVAQMHQRPADPKDPRPFFYLTKKSAINAWFHRFKRALQYARENGGILMPNERSEKYYAEIGSVCIAQYWNKNEGTPRPLEIEKRYVTKLDRPGVVFVGVFDQVREVSLQYIKTHRPDLITNGRLNPDYENVVVMDLKSDKESYDIRDSYPFYKEPELQPTEEQIVRFQYELHESLLPTAYTFLRERVTRKKPVGFIWYHLRSGKAFFTFRDEWDYQTLYDAIDFYLDSMGSGIFPKNPGDQCSWCPHLEECRGRKEFLIAEPEELFGIAEGLRRIPNSFGGDAPQEQLPLKFRIPRRKSKPGATVIG